MALPGEGQDPGVEGQQVSIKRVDTEEKNAVADLPNLHDRITAMGLTQEYRAFRDRYQGWRQGSAAGATGELKSEALIQKKMGFGFWYPRLDVWTWRRTLSYWIAVTFFEGSLFFTFSSFAGCCPEALGMFAPALTTKGYIAGKINFIICTYFMCLETINLEVNDFTGHDGPEHDHPTDDGPTQREPFHWWPFYYRTALGKLRRLGAGPWPYIAAVVYFLGCGAFSVGLAAEFVPLPPDVSHWTKFASFVVGSLLFVAGGLAEMMENECFTTCKWDAGWTGSIVSTFGSSLFLYGSILGYDPANAFWGSFIFGVGSMIFAMSSAVLIFMWKDEQFGLTFFSALNNLIADQDSRVVMQTGDGRIDKDDGHTLSGNSAVFLMIYCFAACFSVYDCLISLAQLTDQIEGLPMDFIIDRSFNELLPCLFAHLMIALNSAVLSVPKEAPYRQLYFGCRILAVLMVVNSTTHVAQTIYRTVLGEWIECRLYE